MSSHPNVLRELTSVDAFERALAASADRPMLIFKHSLTCGTSAMALEEISALLQEPALPVDVYLVRVQASRDVSRAVEATLGIRHESPQALVVSRGEVLWHGSHFRVRTEKILDALQQHLRAVPS